MKQNEPMIPVSVVKNYLENVLAEWNALGDRKYDLPNMQVYNHTRKELDDLEVWISTNCRAATESYVIHTNCEEGVCPICGGKLSYVDTDPDYNWWRCPSCNATGKEGKDYVDGEAVFDGEHYDVYDGNGAPVDIRRPFNEPPLTLDELRKMQGEPVWVCDQGGKGIPVCGVVNGNCIRFLPGSCVWLDENAGAVKCGSWWFAFRNKPSEIKLPIHQKGICPICGEDIEYGDFEMHDEGATYDWECPKCGATGKEGYDLTFDGNHYNVCDANGNEVK